MRFSRFTVTTWLAALAGLLLAAGAAAHSTWQGLAAAAALSAAAPLWLTWRIRRELLQWIDSPSPTKRLDLPGGDRLMRQWTDLLLGVESQSEQRARAAALLEALLESMREGVLAVDDDDRVVFANQAALDIFQLSKPQGLPLLRAVRDYQLAALVAECRQSQAPRETEVEHTSSHGPVFLAANASPLSPGGAVVVMHDVTELRRLESIRRDFVTNVSHELKTPLTSIKAYAETLAERDVPNVERRRRFAQRIQEQAERLNNLILDLISLGRIESGTQSFQIESLDVARVVAACLQQCQAAAEMRQVRLETRGPAAVTAQADQEAMRQILGNLLGNAIKYTPSGGLVEVIWREEAPLPEPTSQGQTPHNSAAGSWAVIEVRDTGIGIPAKHLPRLFERFYRVDQARSRELGGTGLGLSIVKHLTQAFGGSIEVESAEGQGSCFRVRLPTAHANGNLDGNLDGNSDGNAGQPPSGGSA